MSSNRFSASGTMVPLNETLLYTEDWIGLKAIDEVFISLNSFDRFTNPIITDHIIYRPHCCKPWYENLTLNFTSIWAIFPRLVSSIWWRCPEITFSFRRWAKIHSRCEFYSSFFSGLSRHDHLHLPWQLKLKSVKIKEDFFLYHLFVLLL